MICENCGCEHNGSYGSGRFCSQKCSKGFATKYKRKEINSKISKTIKTKLQNGEKIGFANPIKEEKEFICKYCKSKFKSKKYDKIYCSKQCARKDNGWRSVHNKLSSEDWSRIHKKAYENGHNYVAGGTTKWFDYMGFKVQGSYELRVCKILDNWKKTGKIKDWEYTKDRVEYIGEDDKKHSYLLDFKVFENSGDFYYIETKGRSTFNDILKWKSVKGKGYKLEVWFNKDIEENEKLL